MICESARQSWYWNESQWMVLLITAGVGRGRTHMHTYPYTTVSYRSVSQSGHTYTMDYYYNLIEMSLKEFLDLMNV